jgi:glycosyltransferase involved in cell wall biosynthesis
MPSTSVIVPAYQATGFIERAARSVLLQTFEDWEMVLVSDDGLDYVGLLRDRGIADARIRGASTGGTATGVASARNAGLAAAQGRIIATLDADDRLEPTALATMVPLAHEHGACYSRLKIVDHETDEELRSFDRRLATGLVDLEEILTSQIHSSTSVVFDRLRVGAHWNTTGEHWEDTHFFVRCFDYVDRIYHVAEPLYAYYRRNGSICNRPETGREYHNSTVRLLDELDRGGSVDLRRAASRAMFERFLRSRMRLEATFMEDVERGRYKDWREFLEHRLPLFYTLD